MLGMRQFFLNWSQADVVSCFFANNSCDRYCNGKNLASNKVFCNLHKLKKNVDLLKYLNGALHASPDNAVLSSQ